MTTESTRHNEDGQQLSLFGLATDQGEFMSEIWGLLTFYPTKGNGWKDTCKHCLLWVHQEEQTPQDECLSAPCSCDERADGRNGYYSIHNMPIERRIQQ